MTPDQLRIQELETQVQDMRRLLDGLVNASQIDPLVAKTISLSASTTSDKTPASATQTVSESGSSSYGVMKPPTGFISIGGYNVPYIT